MKSNQIMLAKKFAQAFLNVFGADFTSEMAQGCDRLYAYMHTKRQFLVLLNVPMIPHEIKEKKIYELFVTYGLPESCKKLVQLLVHEQQLGLLPEVVRQIASCFKQRHGIETFVFVTSHEVTPEQHELCKKFLSQALSKTIWYSTKIDQTLLAGVRLQSATTLWEYSIDKQLRTLQNAYRV